MALRNWLRSWRTNTPQQPARRPRTRLGVQQLEAREVPAVDLLSALGVGSDAGESRGRDVVADAAGNSYLVGRFSGTADFDPGPGTYLLTARGTADAYAAKYAPDGSLVWARRMGGDFVSTTSDGHDDDQPYSVAVDGTGSVLVVGQFSGTADFGGVTLTSAGARDAFVAKLDPAGQVVWARRWGASNIHEHGIGVGADAAGNVYALGNRVGEHLQGTFSKNGDDVHKFSPTGALLWTRSVNITYNGRGTFDGDLAVDPAGNVYVADTFNGLVDFNPGSGTKWVSSAENQGFVLKITAAGAYGWVSTFRGASSGSDLSRMLKVALDGSGGVLVGGAYMGTEDFDPGPGTTTLPTVSAFDGFVVKLTASHGSFVWARNLGDYVNGLAADAAGNVYVTGDFVGTHDFDPGAGSALRTSAGDYDAFVVKLTANGSFGWVETFGGTGGDGGKGVAVDPSGTIHLAGVFSGTVDFDPDPLDTYELTSPGPYKSSFLVKLRPS
jgi:hypothetical protein